MLGTKEKYVRVSAPQVPCCRVNFGTPFYHGGNLVSAFRPLPPKSAADGTPALNRKLPCKMSVGFETDAHDPRAPQGTSVL